MEEQDFEVKQAIEETERIAYSSLAIRTIMDKVVEADNNPNKIFHSTGRAIVDFFDLILEYADELKKIRPAKS